ncbi:MAG: hypothetical protein GXP45_04220 [bacterium]|nr:hypothetical protein [bacterium]
MKHIQIIVPNNFNWTEKGRLLWECVYEDQYKSSNHPQYRWGGFKMKNDVWRTTYRLIPGNNDVYTWDENTKIQWGDWECNCYTIIVIVLLLISIFGTTITVMPKFVRFWFILAKILAFVMIGLYGQELGMFGVEMILIGAALYLIKRYAKFSLKSSMCGRYWLAMYLASIWAVGVHLALLKSQLLGYDIVIVILTVVGLFLAQKRAKR